MPLKQEDLYNGDKNKYGKATNNDINYSKHIKKSDSLMALGDKL